MSDDSYSSRKICKTVSLENRNVPSSNVRLKTVRKDDVCNLPPIHFISKNLGLNRKELSDFAGCHYR